MSFEIKVGIPAPQVRNAGRPVSKYPFPQMVVGSSIFVDVKKGVDGAKGEELPVVIARLRSNVNRWTKGAGAGAVFRVALYTDQDGVAVLNPVTGAQQVGVWRTE